MCVVSMIGDHYKDKFKPWEPFVVPQVPGVSPLAPGWKELPVATFAPNYPNLPLPTREEFEALKKQVEEMHVLLKKAKKYDEVNKEPNCEMEEKVEFIKQVAKFVGIDLKDIFNNHK